MKHINGKSINKGVAVGKIFFFNNAKIEIERKENCNSEEELQKFNDAKAKAYDQLSALYEKLLSSVGEEEAGIIEVQQMFLEDEDYNDAVLNAINNEKLNAEYAVEQAGETIANIFLSMDDVYMQGRASDIRDISTRIYRNILGIEDNVDFDEPMIVVAEDLTPSETSAFNKDKILAFVTKLGTDTSHTAILARNMDIPSIINVDIDVDDSLSNQMAIVDAIDGTMILNPTDEQVAKYTQLQKELEEEKSKLGELVGKEDVTLDGKKIKLYSNIGRVEDVEDVLANDSKGIGLFRSEFLYMGRDNYPTEDEQFEAYKAVLSKMGDKPVIIRTLDIGADKKADYFNIEEEENPALGYRAIRICLDRPEMFKTQLRALYRASVYGNLLIMFPMIISVEEIKKCKEIAKEVREELKAEGIDFKEVSLGIMIETPASVMLSDALAKEVDFFSVGTNDLTQYTLAVDRQNKVIADMFSAKHPAVLTALQMIVDNAHKNGIWAGICGELASDSTITKELLKMGYDELSISSAKTLEVRKEIRETDLSK